MFSCGPALKHEFGRPFTNFFVYYCVLFFPIVSFMVPLHFVFVLYEAPRFGIFRSLIVSYVVNAHKFCLKKKEGTNGFELVELVLAYLCTQRI